MTSRELIQDWADTLASATVRGRTTPEEDVKIASHKHMIPYLKQLESQPKPPPYVPPPPPAPKLRDAIAQANHQANTWAAEYGLKR